MLRRGAREERRDDRQEDRGGPGGGGGGRNHYQMRQKMVAIGDDFWIENDRGEKVFKVDGKALRVRQTLILEDAHGKELYKIQERMLRVKDSMEVEDANGQRVAMVKKALITPIRERWSVNVKGGPDLEVKRTYGSNALHVQYDGDGRFLKDLPGVQRAIVYENSAELELTASARIQDLLGRINAGVELRKFEVVEPSLHSIFISVVGGDGAVGALPEVTQP